MTLSVDSGLVTNAQCEVQLGLVSPYKWLAVDWLTALVLVVYECLFYLCCYNFLIESTHANASILDRILGQYSTYFLTNNGR